MSHIPFGKLVREIRNRKNISQEELCDGICSVSNLSRIENGLQIPNTITAELIVQRLGHGNIYFLGFSTVEELDFLQTQREVLIDIEHGLLTKYHKYTFSPNDNTMGFIRQRDRLIEAAVCEASGDISPDGYIRALEVTVALQDVVGHTKRRFFYDQEIILLSAIARSLARNGDFKLSSMIFNLIYDYTKFSPDMDYLFESIKKDLSRVSKNSADDLSFVVAPKF